MTSQLVLGKAARSLSPVVISRMFRQPTQQWTSEFMNDFTERMRGWLKLVGFPGSAPTSSSSSGEPDPGKIGIKQVTAKIKSDLSVSFGQTEQLINLQVVSSDPVVSAVVANAVADAYIAFLIENRVSQTERAGKWLADRIEQSRGRLDNSENNLKAFQFREQLLDLSTEKSLSGTTLDRANTALIAAEQRYAQLSKKYGPKHPTLIDARRNLENARSQLGSVSKTDLDANEERFELNKLERAVNSDRALYELFLSRFNEVELGIDAVSSNTKILERASVPSVPFTPNIRKSASSGAVIGLVIGILILLGRELFDRTFKNQGDVEERLQLPVLGVLPLLTTGKFTKKSETLVPERHYHVNTKSNFSEVVNHIRTGIIYSNVDNPPKVILITSPLPREGKTTCATNLSLAFSKIGKTLLIDADFRKPRIAQLANVENIQGLTGYVTGQNSLQECITQDIDAADLYIMKSGEIPPNPLELISSNKFSNTLELMRKSFDYIVIDSAPIIPVSDGVVLGKLADAIIMILKAGSTTHHVSDAAMKRLASAKLYPIGVVLSQLDYKSSHYYYGKYDYYAREYYS
jgi:capsular exopolysaccharide synthesis family protein